MPATTNMAAAIDYSALTGVLYREHRLAWLYMTGEWPTHEIDHINGDRVDNRFCNLREATASENRWNSRKRVNNTSGYKGVSWDSAKRLVEGAHHSRLPGKGVDRLHFCELGSAW
jgi:hypothetical protein